MTTKQQQFLILRSNGKSFDDIAKELNISKVTAIKWNKLFETDLNDMKFIALSTIKEQYANNVVTKYEILLKHLSKVDKAIEELDISNTSLKDLMFLRKDLIGQIERLEYRAEYVKTDIVTKNIFGENEIVHIKLSEVN